jgi:hypothetical protein
MGDVFLDSRHIATVAWHRLASEDHKVVIYAKISPYILPCGAMTSHMMMKYKAQALIVCQHLPRPRRARYDNNVERE